MWGNAVGYRSAVVNELEEVAGKTIHLRFVLEVNTDWLVESARTQPALAYLLSNPQQRKSLTALLWYL